MHLSHIWSKINQKEGRGLQQSFTHTRKHKARPSIRNYVTPLPILEDNRKMNEELEVGSQYQSVSQFEVHYY